MLSLLMQGQYAVFLLLLVALVLSLSFHEYGHAVVAKWFGDDTAQRRSTDLKSNRPYRPHWPRHGSSAGYWLRQTSANGSTQLPVRYRRLVVALAGPGMNLLLALVTWNMYAWFWQNGWQNEGALIFFTLLTQINLLLMLFNLIPLGPLDGHYILPHLLPAGLAQRYRYLNARYGTGVFLALVVLSLAGLPLLTGLAELSRTMLNWITLV